MKIFYNLSNWEHFLKTTSDDEIDNLPVAGKIFIDLARFEDQDLNESFVMLLNKDEELEGQYDPRSNYEIHGENIEIVEPVPEANYDKYIFIICDDGNGGIVYKENDISK